MKTCTKCHIEKEVSDFYFRNGSPRSHCKKCECEYANNWNKNNPKEYSKKLRMWKRDNPTRHQEQMIRASKKHNEVHRDRYLARRTLNNAKARGEITESPCGCGEVKVEAHHHDYSKPLDVIWMCKKCHKEFGE
jgi:hypothetical protein